jgi:two-component system, chemotaxis family, chemotaxis protein CheY
MEILLPKDYKKLLDFLPSITSSLKEWQVVDIKLIGDTPGLPVAQVAELVQNLFADKEGRLYPCNDRELVMVVRAGKEPDPQVIPRRIETRLPPGSCRVLVHEPTPEGLGKLEILIRASGTPASSVFSTRRAGRKENVILVADDDMYMRLLVKKGAADHAGVQEAADGNEVIAAYKEHAPDILFLDIHLPGRSGTEILNEIMAMDRDAFVIMLSADSSRDNVESAMQQGAKGFMAKPFTKERLLEYIKKCPTLR